MYPELENLIQARKTAKALRFIKALYTPRANVEQLLYFSGAYRRLGYLTKAEKILSVALQKRALFGLGDKQRLRIAHLEVINLLGASHYALKIAQRMPVDLLSANERFRLANFYSANYDYDSALKLLLGLDADHFSDYDWQFQCIARADCWAGLEKWPEAEAILELLIGSSHELIAKIAKVAMGEYLVRQGKYQSALDLMLTINMSDGDSSIDHAFYWKWRALAEYHCGQDAGAKIHIKIAENYFNTSNHKPEALLDLYYWKGRFLKTRSSAFPNPWKVALAYPADFFFYRHLLAKEFRIRYVSVVNGKISLGRCNDTRHGRVYIDESSDYCVVNQRRWLGIPKKYSLLAKVVRAGKLGVQLCRLMDTLWPGDLSTQELLEKRLADLIDHLRAEGFVIDWRDQRLYCDDPSNIEVCVGLIESYIGQSFLIDHQKFARQDIEKYYLVSRSRAGEIIDIWKEQGRIQVGSQAGTYLTC